MEAEPGASWLQMDDHLRTRGWGLAEDYTLFGAYDAGGRAAGAEAGLRGVFGAQRGHALPVAGAHRAWGERFFPLHPRTRPPALPASSSTSRNCRKHSLKPRADHHAPPSRVQ